MSNINKRINVILVDEHDNEIGIEEKLKAHQDALLHRAFSIFIFNAKGELMLQQRALDKYHCGGLWTNTCCSHPAPGEHTEVGAHRRLQEEMGFNTKLKEIFTTVYKAELDNGLTEHEFLHVFVGSYDDEPKPNPEEAHTWKWIDPTELEIELKEKPESFTPWFQLITHEVLEYRRKNS